MKAFNIDNFIFTQKLIDDITEIQQINLFNMRYHKDVGTSYAYLLVWKGVFKSPIISL